MIKTDSVKVKKVFSQLEHEDGGRTWISLCFDMEFHEFSIEVLARSKADGDQERYLPLAEFVKNSDDQQVTDLYACLSLIFDRLG